LQKSWLWWKCVFAGVFGEKRVLDVVILWFLRGEMRGEDGQETYTFSRIYFSHIFSFYFSTAL
jgi:hypothetical protein